MCHNAIPYFLSISADNRVACWNVFGNMTPADDLPKDAGDILILWGVGII